MPTVDRPAHRSAQRAMEILGERWTILILHEAFWGVRRFSELQRNLGIARNILSARLQNLTAAGCSSAAATRRTRSAASTG
jgi:DNA-binding HxlR family transcriptional regulator